MTEHNERRQYYRIEDRVPMKLTRLNESQAIPDISQLEREIPSSFRLMNMLQEIESEASITLSSLQTSNPAIAEYLRSLNKRLDLIGGYIAEQEFSKVQQNESLSLSGNGFRTHSEEEFKENSILLVEMLLPNSQTGIHCYGKVIEGRQDGSRYSIAVTCQAIREADREAIIKHVIRQESQLIRQAKEESEKESARRL